MTLAVDQAMRTLEARYTAERPDVTCIDTPGWSACCDHTHAPINRPAGVYPIAVRDHHNRRNLVVLVRFTRRPYGGWFVQRADNGRHLGWLCRPTTGEHAGQWEVRVNASAFRGAGVDDQGDMLDRVEAHLYHRDVNGHTMVQPVAVERTREWAARSLLWHLVREHAPAVGFDRHWGVTEYRTTARQHFPLGEPEHCVCGEAWPNCPKRAALLAAEARS